MKLNTGIFLLSCILLSSPFAMAERSPEETEAIRDYVSMQGWSSVTELTGVVVTGVGYGIHRRMGPPAVPGQGMLGFMQVFPQSVTALGLTLTAIGLMLSYVGGGLAWSAL
jgi:hypothetical protein